MHQKDLPVAKFYKLVNGQDIVAYELSETESHILIKQPMAIVIENDFTGARQLLNVREWLPPIVTKSDEVQLPKIQIMFILDVNETFKEEFKDVVAFFYGVQPKKRRARGEEKDKKVVSIASFLKDDGKIH
jgi:hypothetical protein